MKKGLKATILVRPCSCKLIQDDHFEIINGEQRWTEARDSGIEKLPAMIIIEDEKEAMLDTLIMNIEGEADPAKLVAIFNALQSKHLLTSDEISINSGYTKPQMKIVYNRSEEKIVKERTIIEGPKQLIILCTESELNTINEAMDAHRAKTKKEYQRNGSILAEICGK